MSAVAVCAVALTTWALSGGAARRAVVLQPQESQPQDPSGLAASNAVASLSDPALFKTYFGMPVDGSVVAYVVDGDAAMAPYIQQLSDITNRVNQSVPFGDTRRFGVVRPELRQHFSLMQVAERPNTPDGGEATLSPRLPADGTNLREALSLAKDWYADQLFLVLAKPLSPQETDVLAQLAEQTGAIANVIAVGPAARQDLSVIASATGGRFLPLSDAQFAEWSGRYEEAARSND